MWHIISVTQPDKPKLYFNANTFVETGWHKHNESRQPHFTEKREAARLFADKSVALKQRESQPFMNWLGLLNEAVVSVEEL